MEKLVKTCFSNQAVARFIAKGWPAYTAIAGLLLVTGVVSSFQPLHLSCTPHLRYLTGPRARLVLCTRPS